MSWDESCCVNYVTDPLTLWLVVKVGQWYVVVSIIPNTTLTYYLYLSTSYHNQPNEKIFAILHLGVILQFILSFFLQCSLLGPQTGGCTFTVHKHIFTVPLREGVTQPFCTQFQAWHSTIQMSWKSNPLHLYHWGFVTWLETCVKYSRQACLLIPCC